MITVIVEATALLHCPAVYAPFEVRPTKYEGRKVLAIEFKAFDCGFVPGGNVDVNANRHRWIICFEGRDVLEIKKSDSGVEKNRLLCPTCHYVSLKTTHDLPVAGTAQTRYFADCTRKGCDGRASFIG